MVVNARMRMVVVMEVEATVEVIDDVRKMVRRVLLEVEVVIIVM